MLIVSLVVLGGAVLFLGGLVLLVVGGGINDRIHAPRSRAHGCMRDAVLRSAAARGVTWGT